VHKIHHLWLILVFVLCGCSNTTVTSETNVSIDQNAPLLSPERFLNIAHRGASGYAPEHTILSYELGEKMHGDYIEIDLQMTKDGVLIAMHDADISRTTDKEGNVNEFTLREIEQLDAGTWFNEANVDDAQPAFAHTKIPTLDEIIETFGTESNYYIEVKHPEEYPDMVETLVTTLEKHQLIGDHVPGGKVIIQSFNPESLKEVQQLNDSIPLIQLYRFDKKAALSEKELMEVKSYAIGIGVNSQSLTEQFVRQMRAEDLLLHAYTVNEEKEMTKFINWGVTGIFTDYPDVLHEVLETYQ